MNSFDTTAPVNTLKSFDKQLAGICDVEIAALVGSYKYQVFGSHTFAVEGHSGLACYSTESISFKVSGGLLFVKGKGLTICRLDRHFAVIKGDISSCEVAK